MSYYDYVIVGSGIAGLYTALLAEDMGSVLILTKGSIEDCNTRHAQGGIAAPIGKSDSAELHFQDTVNAGAGLCDPEAVRILVDEAPDRIDDLIKFGVPFDTVNGEVALTREAAHSVARIIHAGGDATGEHIEVTLSRDMEFFQFHPTALRLPGVPPFLISEAVRGEGGTLRNIEGDRFMPDYAREADLAPRDVVARSILYEMRKTGSDRVFLDVTHVSPRRVTTRFPHIYRFCLDHGLDITRGLIPVAPAAHYFMGGVRVNTWGETTIPGLFAAGETACTGVHGANRLASNSLLEVVVFSKRIVERTQETDKAASISVATGADYHCLSQREALETTSRFNLSNLQSLLWDKVGIVRSGQGLAEAADTLAAWQNSLPQPTDRPSYELGNMVLSARLMAEAGLVREESRGAHFRTDFPESSRDWQKHIIFKMDDLSRAASN